MSSDLSLSSYREFLKTKRDSAKEAGFELREPINPKLFPFQRDSVRWAIQRGRSALFQDCGLGKSAQELEYARHIRDYTGGNVLLLTPLAVSHQMKREGDKFDIECNVCRTEVGVKPGINITNYERLHHFHPDDFSCIILDESSILKSYEGKTRKQITEFAIQVPYRLAATATPAPNDLIELTNHSEFLDVMTGKEIIAKYFTQDGNSTQKYKLKGHAREPFWKWMASWSVAMRKPSDLGYEDTGFILPPLNIHPIVVNSEPLDGFLFPMVAVGLGQQRQARRKSLDDRVQATADLVNGSDDQWLVWCDLNKESESLVKAIHGAKEVRGSDSPEVKEDRMNGFTNGNIRVLVTKPSIAGHGMNWQHCHKMAFVGLSYSFELYYQALRRCGRFGQKNPVDAYVVTSESEGQVVEAVQRKEAQAAEMFEEIVNHMAGLSLGRSKRDEMDYFPDKPMSYPDWLVEDMV